MCVCLIKGYIFPHKHWCNNWSGPRTDIAVPCCNHQYALWPGAMGDADSGSSFQRFRGAASCMAGGGKARGILHMHRHLHMPSANMLTHQSSRQPKAQCNAPLLSTLSSFCWVFLGMMSVLCSCKAWIHSSGVWPNSMQARAFTSKRER